MKDHLDPWPIGSLLYGCAPPGAERVWPTERPATAPPLIEDDEDDDA